jgi:hypothetical protein
VHRWIRTAITIGLPNVGSAALFLATIRRHVGNGEGEF